MLSLSVKAQNI